MRLSPHFTLQEMIRSSTADRKGIDNHPRDRVIIENLKMVCLHVLEPVRGQYGIPFSPSSGYRGPELNRAIGGSPRSQHQYGQAVDFEVPGVANPDLAQWCKDHLDFDQLILEFPRRGVPDAGWIHCSYVSPDDNRKQLMTALRRNGKTQYFTGLHF